MNTIEPLSPKNVDLFCPKQLRHTETFFIQTFHVKRFIVTMSFTGLDMLILA